MLEVKYGSKQNEELELHFSSNYQWSFSLGRAVVIFGALFFIIINADAQNYNERCKWVTVFNEDISLDTLAVIPNSINISNSDSAYFLLEIKGPGKVQLRGTKKETDSVLVCYKILPFSFNERYFHRSLAAYDSNARFKDPVKATDPFLQREELFSIEGLNKSGSISRGISFGSNQNAFVNSTLNLNMEGKLTENLNIRAAITDENVPFQPEGNTQQLRDFNNVFIELYNENISITGGDVVLKNRPSHFLKYHKNVQGGLAKLNYLITDSIKAQSSLGISVAKGRFASVKIPALEGVLGPYRIPGPDNENFVIILANSEKVFLDGKLLQRGFNNDYIIDYNSAEISFTNSILITQFSRIRIDYEYSDRNYSRTIAAATHHQEMSRMEFFINAYSEKDNRNKPLLTALEDEDKLLLSNIGDQLEQAIISGADSTGFSRNSILYKKIKAVDNAGNVYEVYKYSTDQDSAVYKVTFSNVGPGNGNYVRGKAMANGTVYQWLPPKNGVPQGQYEPEIRIPAPNKKQMVTTGAKYKINKYEEVHAEIALSDQDINLFSELDQDDNKGHAIKTGIASKGRSLKFMPEYLVNTFTDFEFNDRFFNPVDRFRYIEYDRDWGYNELVEHKKTDEIILNAGVGFRKDSDNGLEYEMSYRKRGQQVNGFQHRAKFDKELGRFLLNASLFTLKNDLDSLHSQWIRYGTEISYRSKWLIPGYAYQVDKHRVQSPVTHVVKRSAMYFNEHSFYLQSGKQSPLEFELRHSIREDMTPSDGDFVDFTKANTTQIRLNKDLEHQKVNMTFAYRNLENHQLGEDEESLSGRLNWQSNWLNDHIRSDLMYSISNSRELKREFVFIAVPTGQGTHTWRDLNDDNLQDLNEFFVAINPDERNYAKIFVPTKEFVTAFQNLFVYRISFDMPMSWRKENGLKKFLSRFSSNTSWSADIKTTDTAIETRLFAFAKDVEQKLLLSEKSLLRSTLFYNRTSTRYGAEVGYLSTNRKQLLSGGFDSRATEEYNFSFRLNLSRLYSLKIHSSTATKDVQSDFLEGRNYRISTQKVSPELAWQPTGNVRISGQYGYKRKQNVLKAESAENASADEFMLNVKFNKAVRNTFKAQLKWVEITFEGQENTPIGYDLLNALRPGTNITWGVNWQQKIASGLQVNLSYNGRKSEGVNVVHLGSVQVNALF